MKLQDIVSINFDLLENILLEKAKQIPGVSVQSIEKIVINNKDCCVDIYITPFKLLANNYSIAYELQQAISFHLCKQFDLEEGQIKINVFVEMPKEEN